MKIKDYMKEHVGYACFKMPFHANKERFLFIGFSAVHEGDIFYFTDSKEGPYFFGFYRDEVEKVIHRQMEDKFISEEMLSESGVFNELQ